MSDNPEDLVLLEADQRGVATVTLNRPEMHNAMNGDVIERLADIWDDLDKQDGIRAVVVQGAGRSFCAGGDLNWMKAAVDFTLEENLEDAATLAYMLNGLYQLSKPTIALIHGNCMAGGIGLAAACDVAIAVRGAHFALTEVKIGLIPATISPYVLNAIGPRQAKRYFLTAERFDADRAAAIGLIHDVVEDAAALHAARDHLLDHFLAAAPEALNDAKKLIDDVAFEPIDPSLIDETARRIAERRVSEEGQEGLASFLEKRKPEWTNRDV